MPTSKPRETIEQKKNGDNVQAEKSVNEELEERVARQLTDLKNVDIGRGCHGEDENGDGEGVDDQSRARKDNFEFVAETAVPVLVALPGNIAQIVAAHFEVAQTVTRTDPAQVFRSL